ncbi:MAG TPA: Mpo1-like protein [Myxococcota bacterium]|nr:Mpo1-like protein [Myxococcota bacterium]
MKTIQQWFLRYGESHQNPTNLIIHKFAVPAIVLSILGMLWALPTPWHGLLVNWSTLFVLGALVFYLRLSMRLALGMALVAVIIFAGFFWLSGPMAVTLWPSMVVLFVASWIFQFIGHMIEGKKPSFFEDLQFLLIGPLWLLAMLYRRLNIKY